METWTIGHYMADVLQNEPPPRAPRILCVIFDHGLALLLCAALERAGFSTVRATSLEQGLQALSRGSFAAVLLGHFVPREHAVSIVTVAHRQHIPCVALFSRVFQFPSFADAHVDVADGHAEVLRVLRQQFNVRGGKL